MKTLRKQAGVALVTAIFLLVVLAGLAVAVVSLSSSQQDAAVKDEMGTRAYLAARSGMEWALFTATQGPGTKAANLNCPQLPGAITFQLPQGTTLQGFTVSISCTAVMNSYGGGMPNDPTDGHFRITVTACNAAACPAANPGPDYVQRVISAQL
ncbi:agglutinin biogenesis protein MshP [Pseudoduganella sp. FT55W]|uniref:Agglutinin biogenesis protein MshP n=1 Tax=Duganella rivi TaxID=2666083 RepID=A0A7X4GQ61_9BURK|nr:agglutinin biogenesis protein MshP [Duganella rivi]MYM67632.1 agglutinin biogenesis protein MshP [Duganella rivi]